jgi:ferritin-like metal-binding protein YciE
MAMKMNSLEELFIDNLKDLYDAEHQIIKALPKMVDAASSQDLKKGFQQHLDVTKEQVKRLEQIFTELNQKPSGKKCLGMEGLIKEGEEVMSEMKSDPDARDAGMIAAAQKIEHYEISGYGTARTYANTLGHQRAASLLEKTLQEESQTDEKLTRLAESHINVEAMR